MTQYELDNKLHEAAENGHLPVVEFLVTNGDDIHVEDETPLGLASFSGHLPVVEFLVANGADIHADSGYPLRVAAHNGHLPVVEFLVANGADINITTENGTDTIKQWIQSYTNSINLNNKLQHDLNAGDNFNLAELRKKI